MKCIYFRMKIQDQAAIAVLPALKSEVLPSQRKAPQALLHPRSEHLFQGSTVAMRIKY